MISGSRLPFVSQRFIHRSRTLFCSACARAASRRVTKRESDEKVRTPSKSLPPSNPEDFFGIKKVSLKYDVAGTYSPKAIDKETLIRKYGGASGKDIEDSHERVVATSFGVVRFDSDNSPKTHGQFHEQDDEGKYIEELDVLENESSSNERVIYKAVVPRTMKSKNPVQLTDILAREAGVNVEENEEDIEEADFIENQYFGAIQQNNEDTTMQVSRAIEKLNDTQEDSKSNEIESQYFGDVQSFIEEMKKKDPYYKDEEKLTYKSHLESDLNAIDKQYFEFSQKPVASGKLNFWYKDMLRIDEGEYKQLSYKSKNKSKNPFANEEGIPSLGPSKFAIDYDENQEGTTEEENQESEQAEAEESKKVETIDDIVMKEPPQFATAKEYLDKIKSGDIEPTLHFTKEGLEALKRFDDQQNKEKLDSKGFRILSYQVPDFSVFTQEDIIALLMDNILFNDADILALNKPYGLVCQGGDMKKGDPVLTDLIPGLAKALKCQNLYPVHRLDKETTGLLLLAKSEEKADFLRKLFAERKIAKLYWCITKNIPDEKEGIIDIPIEQINVAGKQRMVLRPAVLEETRRIVSPHQKGKRAVTWYKVIGVSGSAALIECRSQTGIKHQIRVHLGFGLRCPILGDHKYSHLDSLKPQTLPQDLLLKLRVRQTKVRYIPMHLHARQIMIPGAGNNERDIYINCPLPNHFVKNMKSLKLTKEKRVIL